MNSKHPIQDSTRLLHIAGWTLRVKAIDGPEPFPVVILLHGWTGDENAMWVFTGKLPQRFYILSPRGIFPSSVEGYSWVKHLSDDLPQMEDFNPAITALRRLLDTPGLVHERGIGNAHLIGFSQGAALAYAFALEHPERVHSIAGLSGFLPAGFAMRSHPSHLSSLPIFVAHGTQDQLVAIERGRQSVRGLQQAGGEVTYCEDDVGHKLSAGCMRALGRFYQLQK